MAQSTTNNDGLIAGLNGSFWGRLLRNSDMMLAIGVLVAIAMIVIPLPSFLLDFFMAMSILSALMIVVVSVFIHRALDFSVFPSVLLMTTVFRIALNVSSTRLILSQGANFNGQVVRAFSDFVVGGEIVVGVIVFVIITAAQFIIITKGATRVSEVGARFKLDAMPGKQMAIDAELSNGMISQEEAIFKRRAIEDEADFFGNMDGASKFVSGDVRFGLLLTIINIVGGLVVGIAIRNEGFQDSLQNYVALAVGDGLVSSIPSLLISVSAGVIVTRSQTETGLGTQFAEQLILNPRSLYVTAGFFGLLGVIPGFPNFLFFLIAGFTAFMGWNVSRMQSNKRLKDDKQVEEEVKADEDNYTPEKMTRYVQVDPLEIELGYALIPLVDKEKGGDLLERIKKLRMQVVMELGLVVPNVRLTDNMQLEADEYQIKINGDSVGGASIKMQQLLAMNTNMSAVELDGMKTIEPVFGLPAYWVDEDKKDEAERNGYTVVDGPTIVATHLTEVVKHNARDLLNRNQVKNILDSVRERNSALMEEVSKAQIKTGDIQKVLQELLAEGISIRNIDTILEKITDLGSGVHVELVTEEVRERLKRSISQNYADDKKVLNTMVFDSQLEAELTRLVGESQGVYYLNLTPELLQSLVERLEKAVGEMREGGFQELLLTDNNLRRPLRRLLAGQFPALNVMAHREVAENYKINVVTSIE